MDVPVSNLAASASAGLAPAKFRCYPSISMPMVTRLQPADLDAEAIEWARQQPPGEKLVAGPDLFDLSCEFMKAGIRREFPHLGEDAISGVLRARLDDARQQSNRPYSEDD